MRVSSRLLLAAAAVSMFVGASAERHSALPFIADDYPGALARARAKNLPIFVEAWAPW
jgi:hypothetical protein